MRAREWTTLMAEYNRFMNEKLHAMAAELTEDERTRDLGAFFRSIHGTLNHLMWCDRIFIARLLGEALGDVPPPNTILHERFDALREERRVLDSKILEWARSLDDAFLDSKVRFGRGRPRMLPAYVVVAQMFNHQTHHRGQATALFTRLGRDPGITDIPYMPFVDTLAEPTEPEGPTA